MAVCRPNNNNMEIVTVKETMMSKLIFVVVLLCFHLRLVRSQEPQIVEDILPEVKWKGQSGFLNCTVSRQGDNKVYWMQGDHHISSDVSILAYNEIINGQYKYEVRRQYRGNDRTVYTIVVNRLREEDDGMYLCKIYLRGVETSKWPMKYGRMTVQVPPTIVVSATSNTEERLQGNSVDFRCNATGAPTPNITWIRADGKPLPDGRLLHWGSQLHIERIKMEDRGTYRCVADNTVPPPAHHDAKLIVYFSPQAIAVQDSVGQAQNGRYYAILECIVTGMPEPNLRWFRSTSSGQVIINDDEKYQISQLLNHGSSLLEEIWYSLKILNVQANDFTEYTCEGKNDLGSASANLRLYETSECQGTDCPSMDASSSGSILGFNSLHPSSKLTNLILFFAVTCFYL